MSVFRRTFGAIVRRTAGHSSAHEPQAAKRNLLEQYPEAVGMVVTMGEVTYRVSNMDPFELYCLAAIARIRKPGTIFEFGTYDGATTLWMAKTLPEAKVYTLDLPPELRAEWDRLTLASGPDAGDELGAHFRDTRHAARITQLLGDSRTFDFSDYFGRMDLVIVDADHSYECARSDTENALKMVSPNGIVVWDDYHYPGVIRAVDEAAARHGFTAVRLAPTELAVYDRSAPICRDPDNASHFSHTADSEPSLPR